MTPEIRLRDVADDDIAVFFEFQRDPEATAMADFPARDRAAHEIHWAQILATHSVGKQTVLVDGQVAGSLVSWGTRDDRFVGYWFGRAFWGRGVATAALAAYLERETIRPLLAHVAADNAGSRRVLEKCGFRVVKRTAHELELRLDG